MLILLIIRYNQKIKMMEKYSCFNVKSNTNESQVVEKASNQEWVAPAVSKKEKKKTVSPNQYVHWSPKQQRKYVEFLIDRKDLFDLSLEDRKKVGIHTKMSKFIRGRSSAQCRSHHQKMVIKYGSVEKIIEEFKDLVVRENLDIPECSQGYQQLNKVKIEDAIEKENEIQHVSGEKNSEVKEEHISENQTTNIKGEKKSAFGKYEPYVDQYQPWNTYFNPMAFNYLWNMSNLWQQ